MSFVRAHSRTLFAALAAGLLGLSALPAVAAPSAGQVAESRERVDAAARRLEQAVERRKIVAERLEQSSARLDAIVAEQTATRSRLTSRARTMYRSGNVSMVEVLLGAATFEEFTTRWHLLTRMNRQDAEDLARLQLARKEARVTTDELLRLQAESVRLADEIERELGTARIELAADQRAVRESLGREATRHGPPKRVPRPLAAASQSEPQSLRGKGAWKTAVASHYGINFTGRGASGAEIGPYSMIVAHKTLPFGTLIEFEYGGKRAVASVQDRGPHVAGREFDLGPGVARVLGFEGVNEVRYRVIER